MSDVKKCIENAYAKVAMQMYAFFNSIQLKHTNIMFKKFPKSMKARKSWRFEKKAKYKNRKQKQQQLLSVFWG